VNLKDLTELLQTKWAALDSAPVSHPSLQVDQIDLAKSTIVAERLHADVRIKLIEFEGDNFRIEERGDRGSFIVAASRNHRIFKCKCGALDSVDKCKFCGSTEIDIFIRESK